MSIDQLVARFAEIGIAQDEAILYDEHAKYRRLYRQMDEVEMSCEPRRTLRPSNFSAWFEARR